MRRGQAYTQLYLWPQALADYKQCIPLYKNVYQWQNLAFLYLAAEDQTNYRRTCELLVQKYGDVPKAIQPLGFICHHSPQALRDYKPLLTLVSKQIKQEPSNVILKVILGMLQYRAGQYQASIGTLTPILTVSSPWPDAWMYLAMAHYRLRNSDTARNTLARAEAGLLYSPPPITDWYTSLMYRMQLREAKALIGEVDPSQVDTILRRLRQRDELLAKVDVSERAQQWAEAVSSLSELIRVEPENAQFHLRRERAYLETHRLPEALADFKDHLIPALPPGNLPKSQDGQMVDMMFYNNTASAVKLFWINFDGKPVAYATIPPHALSTQAGTYVTHVWLITDMNDKPLVGYIVPVGGGLALIEAK